MRLSLGCRPALLGLALASVCLASAGTASAEELPPIAKGIQPPSRGRPSVHLDRLTFPTDLPNARALERHFRFHLKRAAKRADWGAARGAKIEFRVTVEELSAADANGVLKVRCTALGRLPGNKSARSHIAFGGNPRERDRTLKHVLEIVARGVVTRLAALERERRHARSN